MSSESGQISPPNGAFPDCCQTDQKATILWEWRFFRSSPTILSLPATARLLGVTTAMAPQPLAFEAAVEVERGRGWGWGKLERNEAHCSYQDSTIFLE